MPVAWEQIEPLLMRVGKPARYVGGEINQVVKPGARVRCCLAFPDSYELGMSYHGFRLLYERVNRHGDWAAERAYCPMPDFEELLREGRVPLYSLETRRALNEFDWVGFTLQHEVNFTNILTMIELGGIELEAKNRREGAPILIGGGEGAYSPEPMAPFFDAFNIGDGEETIEDAMRLFERAKTEGWTRERILKELTRIPSFYVPKFYETKYHDHGTIASFGLTDEAKAMDPPPPLTIHKRYYNVANDEGSTAPVTPLMRTVHDRISIEIRRGCVNGCRFCQAGMINRPVHERAVEQILDIAEKNMDATGYNEISLLSLSSADYTMIAPLVRTMIGRFAERRVSVSLPSLRINGFDIALVDEIARGRKTGFTFAPEAGSERLRRVINKPVDQDNFRDLIEDVLRRGWRTVKFYFMIGLPTETDADLNGIIEIVDAAAKLGRRHHGGKARVNVTLSPFVPKPQTPFQWEAQPPVEELRRRYQYVREALKTRWRQTVDVKSADTGSALVEAALARGDRRIAAAVRRAWELGARFDGWEEHFKLGIWRQAFEETGLSLEFYAGRERDEDEILPFDHIEADLGRRFLWADRQRAYGERTTEKCDTGRCAGCQVCNDDILHTLARDMPGLAQELLEKMKEEKASAGDVPPPQSAGRIDRKTGKPVQGPEPARRMRVRFAKRNALRFLSHLDFMKIVQMSIRRTSIPLAHTHGFNPQPRIEFAPPMSLGMGGEAEIMDLYLDTDATPEFVVDELRSIALDGLEILGAQALPTRGPSLDASIVRSHYRCAWALDFSMPLDEVRSKCKAFEAAEAFPIEVRKKRGVRTMELKAAVEALRTDEAGVITMAIRHGEGIYVKPHIALGHLLMGRPLELGVEIHIDRTGLELETEKR